MPRASGPARAGNVTRTPGLVGGSARMMHQQGGRRHYALPTTTANPLGRGSISGSDSRTGLRGGSSDDRHRHVTRVISPLGGERVERWVSSSSTSRRSPVAARRTGQPTPPPRRAYTPSPVPMSPPPRREELYGSGGSSGGGGSSSGGSYTANEFGAMFESVLSQLGVPQCTPDKPTLCFCQCCPVAVAFLRLCLLTLWGAMGCR
eukprot:COSAG01_NODE_5102_length_4484_cov_2.707184_2_plen_205_part_00